MKVVKFLYPYSPYIRGDVAGFEDDVANALIKKGFAVLNKKQESALKPRATLKDNTKDRQMKSDNPNVLTK